MGGRFFGNAKIRYSLVLTLILSASEFIYFSLAFSASAKAEESETEFRNQSFADFLYLTNKERDVKDSILYFWTPDTINGPFHSNDTIHIQPINDEPFFAGRVTTSSNVILPLGNHARFDEGWGYRSRVAFPDSATEIRQFNGIVDSNGQNLGSPFLDSMTQVAISHDTLYVRRCFIDPDSLPDTIWHCSPDKILESNKYLIPPSGCVFIEGMVLISAAKGVVDQTDGPFPFLRQNSNNLKTFRSAGIEGQLTIGTSDTLLIGDDVLYNHCNSNYSVPSTMDSCSDILGLVSENFIMLSKNARINTHINAALAAIKGSISVQDIYDYDTSDFKLSLKIWGSLAQCNRGKIHTMEINNERGFRGKDYNYDVRLQDNPPPHFPRTQGN